MGRAMRLEGKTVVLTGAARGIGHACAVRFAAEGADLTLVDIGHDIATVPYPLGSKTQLAHTAELCRRQGAAVLTVTADVRDPNGAESIGEQTLERFGTVDALVNCAGIVAPAGRLAHELDEEEWLVHLEVNLTGPWRMLKALAPVMAGQRSGSIVNIASTAGLVGYRHFAGYVAAKHGLVGLSKAAALDYAPFQVRVNALCPGSVRDDPVIGGRMLGEIARSLGLPMADHEQIFLKDQPTNTLTEPHDIASAALWLASDESRNVTGTVVTVDGGFTAR
jgi:NAD(P)-dependent dehydrogenase (short-subunit alcohol dehydrogenase family)